MQFTSPDYASHNDFRCGDDELSAKVRPRLDALAAVVRPCREQDPPGQRRGRVHPLLPMSVRSTDGEGTQSALPASIDLMLPERRIPTRSPEWRELYQRTQRAMELTSRLNVLPFSDVDARRSLLAELFGDPNAENRFVHPPFYCTSGTGTRLGERASVGQACSFLDLGGITIGERTMISPKVTLITEGHPIEPVDRYAFITVAPILIGARVWVGAAATILPGVTIGHDSVVGAGAVIAKDVPPLTVVTGHGHVVRRLLEPTRQQAPS
jgi:acetyltransferase-like isoleucine patch superfamily enzyme